MELFSSNPKKKETRETPSILDTYQDMSDLSRSSVDLSRPESITEVKHGENILGHAKSGKEEAKT